MSLWISFFIGIQMLHLVVTSPPFRFLPSTCNSSEVKVAAEVALNKLNAHRKEGYVLGLQRIFDVHEILQWMGGSLFYITLDVLETECHVQSRQLWKDCKIRDAHETVYGQCKVIIHFNQNSNHSQLYNHDCVLSPISSDAIAKICPDCPTPGDPSEATFWETAAESLAKFNAESNHVHYFTILNVTKATSQWVIGPSNFVEYTIQETSCPKSQPVSIITKCPLLPANTAEAGLCQGSVVNSRIENRKFVTVKCHFFPHPSGSKHQVLHHPHVNATETSTEHKEAVVEVIDDHPSSKHAVPEGQEPIPTLSPTLASPEQEANSHLAKPAKPTIPPFPKGFSQSASCPGEVAIQIYGLQLPSPPQAEASETKSDVQH